MRVALSPFGNGLFPASCSRALLVDIWFQPYKTDEKVASATACAIEPSIGLRAARLSPIDWESHDFLKRDGASSGHDEAVEPQGAAVAGGQPMLHRR